jgi:hypothetical protein
MAMQTRSSAATARLGSRSSASGRLAGITLFLCLAVAPALAGLEGHGMRGFAVQHDNRTAHSLYYSGTRVGVTPNAVYRGPLAAANRELRESQNSVVPNPVGRAGKTGREEPAFSMRAPNPPGSIPSFTTTPQEPKRNQQTNVPTNRSTGLNPGLTSEARARIDSKFAQYKNKMMDPPGIAEEHRDRLDRSRAFLVNLLDLGYAPSLVDSWCDDLLDDQVATGMPMDLVDLYWGQPVATQEFVDYYIPYELCTYLTDQGDYRQVTYNNRIVSQPISDAANIRNR